MLVLKKFIVPALLGGGGERRMRYVKLLMVYCRWARDVQSLKVGRPIRRFCGTGEGELRRGGGEMSRMLEIAKWCRREIGLESSELGVKDACAGIVISEPLTTTTLVK